jgi:tetratricopeptide (TPR) repeat protein
MNGRPLLNAVAVLLLLAGANAGAETKRPPTIADLNKRQAEVRADDPVEGGADRARQNYEAFLNLERGDAALRAEAMRRLGDLKLEAGEADRIEKNLAQGSPLDTSDAILLYTKLLAAYPKFERNDAVLYQLARAYEADQQDAKALATLDQLVRRYPASSHRDEADFRRGEMLFMARRWPDATAAYAAVITIGPRSEFYEQSLYKHGWALFKRGESEAALDSFSKLLDRKLLDSGGQERDIEGFTRPQRELVEDTLRVCAITFSFEDDAKGVDAFLARHGNKPYAHLLYATLGDLYVSKERWTDAANAYRAFAKRQPNHESAPLLQMQAIEAYKRGGFASLVLNGKREYVQLYRLGSTFWASRKPTDAPLVVRELKTNVQDLAGYYHSQAQSSKLPSDYQEAARWYREYLQSFPDDPEAAATNYLLADTLFESLQYRDAALEYEHTAYGYPQTAKSATAGYAALVAYEKAEAEMKGDARSAWHHQALDSGLRFATTFPQHAESAPVLVRTARELYDLKDYAKAVDVADLVLARRPPVDVEKQKIAWTVIANGQFELGQFDKSEGAYLQVQTLLPPNDPQRPAIDERIAASVYKQGEAHQAAGDEAAAIEDFLRVGKLAPTAKIRATADYDAAALLLGKQEWARAIEVLEGFRRNFPNNELQPEVTRKLAAAYLEGGNSGRAAIEFERIANAPGGSPDVQRDALAQAATLYEKSGDVSRCVSSWDAYVKRFPMPFEPAMEARAKLADLAKQQGDLTRRSIVLGDIVKADQAAGSGRTDRSRSLAASAALELAGPVRDEFNSIQLTLPLKKSLDAKRTAMQRALRAYEAADGYAVAEVSTAATYEMAEMYRHLSDDLMKSERPKSLKDEELEQYNLLLEDQADPFIEKAIEIHIVNAVRASQGIYDNSVRASFTALAKLKPARFAKIETHEDLVIDAAAGATPIAPPPPPAPLPPPKGKRAVAAPSPPPPEPAGVPLEIATRFQEAVAAAGQGNADRASSEFAALAEAAPAFAGPPLNLGIMMALRGNWAASETALVEASRRHPGSAVAFAELGVVYRQLGRFVDSEHAYEQALALDSNLPRTHRNFGVLLDLYMQKPADALTQYESSLTLAGGEDKQMSAWIAELKQRLGSGQKSARMEAR